MFTAVVSQWMGICIDICCCHIDLTMFPHLTAIQDLEPFASTGSQAPLYCQLQHNDRTIKMLFESVRIPFYHSTEDGVSLSGKITA